VSFLEDIWVLWDNFLQRLSRPSTSGSHRVISFTGKLRYIDNITKKASNALNFLKRNLKYCPKQCKEVAYFALVRSTVEYGSAVWDPHAIKEKDKVERVNRRAARMVSNDYGRHSSSPPCSPDLAGLLLNSDVRISGWPWCTKWCMDLWQYPQLILPQQIPAPEPTTVLSFGLSVISNPSFREPFLLGTSYQQKPPKLRPSMHSSIVFL